VTTRILRSEEPLLAELRDGIRSSRECLFTVAYLDTATADELVPLIQERLASSKTFSLRLLIRVSDYFTSPAALMQLMSIVPRGAKHRLQVRYSTHPKFHAKAFGFRNSKSVTPIVIVGSANLLGRAIEADSGELGVVLANSKVATEGWAALESFWAEGRPITTRWLTDYDQRWHRIEARRKKLRALIERQPTPRRASTYERRVPVPPSLFLYRSSWMEPDRVEEITQAAANEGIMLPGDYYDCSASIARTLPRQYPFLDLTRGPQGLATISLVNITEREPIRVRAARASILPWTIVRGSRMSVTKAHRVTFERALKSAGLLYWFEHGNDGYLRGRRLPLLKVLAKIGWKPAVRLLASKSKS
jgi:hypothetical protein